MPSKRFAFASSLWSFFPIILVILLFAFTDLTLYHTSSETSQGYHSLFIFTPFILLLFIIYHFTVGFIQTTIKQPKFQLALLAPTLAAIPIPLLIATSKSGAMGDERLALMITALIIFALFWLSLFAGSCYQWLKIKGLNVQGTKQSH